MYPDPEPRARLVPAEPFGFHVLAAHTQLAIYIDPVFPPFVFSNIAVTMY